ncbi:envelope stress sensor histidine kinase CpxA [Photobacterium ganghwense]|uniref:histidine kinase n=1 Tax=Photobacterium ganghwense TaxID=320778 RepID=A0A0J1H1J7_9GAMM|nr:envelope stress sensor histidine kinase CpxA [Photobacterium ganghwense]KLV05676.1 two-component sensor protein [Photobacterium ganghwense]MBV1841872.1 envelope stress sensor histidine kinase CpxA [Photobacterium ganghwense]PSU06211.1 two-component system sensor histidine kinase CpxA [Photobacterium ganghwense]QSV14259.1 envelope stress sensor histidine kinase CpxA [Photobacterium ganghwense]
MKLPRFSSLYGRIFAVFWLTLLIVVLTLLLLPHLDPRTQHTIPEPQLQRYHDLAADVADELNQGNAALEQKLQRFTDHQRHRGFQLYFTTVDTEIIAPTGRNKALRNFITMADSPDAPRQKLYGRWMMAGPFPISYRDDTLLMYVGRIWREPPPFFLQILDKPFQLLLVTMLVSTPLLLWLAWAISIPARRLQQAAERVTRGEFEADPRLEAGPSEFKQAGASFNQMVQAINQMIGGQQRLLSDISHELRSPLTRLRMATALAQRKQGESKELTRIDTEAERLEKMISELLELSRMQVNSHDQRELCDAQALWFEMLEDARFEAEQCGKQLEYTPLQAWPLRGNPNLLISALENVVRNAIRYGNDQIRLEFTHTDDRLIMTVDDNGDGVPEAELGDIFRPFYRVSTARDRSSGGTGLGLAITDSAIRQHSGKVTASRSPLGGLRVTLTLPLAIS